ncbi:MAG: hypothetical protein KDD04_09805, partial [Sinomicrobium sp.]|nr:hypothetical protein [Sinomicrobium sp.]
MKALQELGHNVQGINSARSTGWLYRIFLKISHFFGFYPDYAGLNRDIRDAISLQKFDIVWVDK